MGGGVDTPTSVDADLVAFCVPDELDTPVAVVDVDRLEANLSRMHRDLAAGGIELRPHLKTAKSIEVARRALDAGAACPAPSSPPCTTTTPPCSSPVTSPHR